MPSLRLSQLLGHLAEAGLPATLEGDDRVVRAVNTLEDAGPEELSFLANPRYGRAARETAAGAVLARPGAALAPSASALRCEDPYAAVTVSIVLIHGYRQHPDWGVHPSAHVDPSARLGKGVCLGPGVSVGADAEIGADSVLYPGCFVGPRARLGRGCALFPNVVVYEDCILGDRVTVHAGSVIGQDGLGYAPVEGRWLKIPQVGRARLGDDVEIGANCCIDRATLGETAIEAGTKLGNGVVVGHGSVIGRHSLLVGQNGLAGSSRVGDGVTLAGQASMVGHIRIGDGATVAAKGFATRSVEENATVMGSPALPVGLARRVIASQKRLPALVGGQRDLARRVRELERALEALHTRLAADDDD